MADVFISYSRKNSDFAKRLIEKLNRANKESWVDWEGIPLTAPNWWGEIKAGIEGADNFIFIMSPDSMASVVCNMELDYAIELRKRIVPVAYQDVDSRASFAFIADHEPDAAMEERLSGKDPLVIARDNWQRLSHINWVFFRDTDDFDAAFEKLITTVETDLDYVKAHTRYLGRAQEWLREKRRSDLLLFGEEIQRAEEWLEKAESYLVQITSQANSKVDVVNPLPQDIHREYIQISRKADNQRQRIARTVQVSIAILVLVLILGGIIGSAIITNTQQQVALAQGQLTAVEPTLTEVGQQVVTAQEQANFANTQAANANDVLTSVPSTLTEVGQQVVTAQRQANLANTQVADANNSLTSIAPTLTEVNQQAISAQGQANNANTQVANANDALTQVPPTLTAIAQLVEAGENQIESLRLANQAADILNQPTGNMELAALLSIRALNTAYTSQADQTLVEATDRLFTVNIYENDSSSVVFSPDRTSVLSLTNSGILRLWDTTTGETIRSFRGHSGVILDAAFSGDGASIVSLSDDSTIRLWDVATGNTIRVIEIEPDYLETIMFSPDNAHILGGHIDGTLRLWDTTTGEIVRVLSGHTDAVLSIAFSSDGTSALSGNGDGTLRLWDVATGQTVRVFSGHTSPVFSVAFSSDGTSALSGNGDGTLRLWDVATGQTVRVFSGHTDAVYSVAFSLGGTSALSGGRDGTLRLWDVATGQTIQVLSGHTDSVNTVAFNPNRNQILSSSSDGSLRTWMWNLPTVGIPRIFRGTEYSGVYSTAFSPDGAYAISAGTDSVLHLWNISTGENVRNFYGHTGYVFSIVFSSDGKYALSGGSGLDTLRLWDVATGETIRVFESTGAIEEVVFSPNDAYALGSFENNLHLWDVSTGELIQTFVGHNGYVKSVAFSPDGLYIISGGEDNTLRLWNAITGEIIHVYNGHTDVVSGVAFSPDGRYILSTSWDGTMRLWDVANGETRQVFLGHSGRLWSGAFSPDGQYALSSSSDSTLRLWNVATGETVRVLSGHTDIVYSGAFSSDGRYIISGSWDGTTRLWDTNYEDFIDYACNRVFRDLTIAERQLYNIADYTPTCPQLESAYRPIVHNLYEQGWISVDDGYEVRSYPYEQYINLSGVNGQTIFRPILFRDSGNQLVIGTTFSRGRETETDRCGLVSNIISANDTNSLHIFDVDNLGVFRFGTLLENEWQPNQLGDVNNIRLGTESNNEMILIVEDTNFTVLINNELVGQFTDNTLNTGDIGITGATFGEGVEGSGCTFRNTWIWDLRSFSELTLHDQR